MKLRFDESQIRYYADKYLKEEKGYEGYERYDDPVKEIANAVKQRGYLTKSDLIVLSHWAKNWRQTGRIKSNSDGCVEEKTRHALNPETAEPDRIGHLTDCLDGVGPLVASAILHWFHQDDYPIWSGPARYSVHLDETRGTPQLGEWKAYVKFCRKLAKENEVDMRTLDRALWKYCDDQRA